MRGTIHCRFYKCVRPVISLLAIQMLFTGAVHAGDPFSTDALTAQSAGSSLVRTPSSVATIPCQFAQQTGIGASPAPLSLPDVVDRALCNNPQTREAWANARYQAAQVGMAQSAYLPSVGLILSESRNRSSGANDVNYNQTAVTLSLNYLLYDFGGREATLRPRTGLAR